PSLSDQDLVSRVSTPSAYMREGKVEAGVTHTLERLVVLDYGIKGNILQSFQSFVREMVVLPAKSTFEDIKSYQPDGVFLSNGPGDPNTLSGAIAMAKSLIQAQIPTFGICLGHQILAAACGLEVEKMPFGHHGGNHPVKDLESGRILITSQNHNYAVALDSIQAREKAGDLRITHLNLNDGTVEGFRHLNAPVSSVQFHPEASPGPHDSLYLLKGFIEQAKAFQELSKSS
ncbi:MAG: carbamoyl phosphate synthase small subunit, partial [Cyanobacteria bacterium]|nr:carbamoyl phosphate synthase small subunit [Cyanobacteriota bacterium]